MKRRELILGTGAALLLAAQGDARAQPVPSRKLDPLRLGVDYALMRNGLAAALKRGFNTRTGLSIKLVPGSSTALIEALDGGELDGTLTIAPEVEARLEQQGLAHDRHAVAQLDFVLVGPVDKKGKDPAGVAGGKFITAAMAQLGNAFAPFLGHTGGTGTHLLEQALWRSARVSPEGPWYTTIRKPDDDALAQAAAEKRYVLVDRARWNQGGAPGMAVLVQGDLSLRVPAHVMRPFRYQHPTGRLLTSWLSGPLGQRVAGSVPGVHRAVAK